MSEEALKSRWDVEHQRWIHPDLPTEAVSKKKRGRRRSQREDEVSADALDQQDQRYNAAIAAIDRKHEQWEVDQEWKFGTITFRDAQGKLVRNVEGKIVIQMSERFAALLIQAEAAGDLAVYPAGDPRGSFESTNPSESFGWKDADAAAKYGAEISERDPRRTENNYASTPAEIEEAPKAPEANHSDDAIDTAESL